jgi:hypothetical protein
VTVGPEVSGTLALPVKRRLSREEEKNRLDDELEGFLSFSAFSETLT